MPNSNNNYDNDNNNNNNNNNDDDDDDDDKSSNDVIIKSIKNAKSKYFLLLPDEWACSKEKKLFSTS